MASTSTVSLALPLTSATHKRLSNHAFFNPLPASSSSRSRKAIAGVPTSNGRLVAVRSSLKKAITGLTAAALTASMVIPEVAEAAGPGVSPSLKNFLLSIAAGGTVVVAILGAVIGVSNFDPVKRG
ncbi:uncharacterized protein LOC111780616 [Cucurbita pepo subsp. pepo]|uniref:uncharacterized protein LOC111780616 n=1 Tax=Cucurbita pepo subsp. pepo TaxID=3664 RepID=UPI000C9D304E|nr:uncharacterized protein LOC111780616 [Cucurbita pepo subsp. pepo]